MKYFLFFCLTITSCIDTAKTLPSSTGKNSELIFVIDDALWTSSVALLSKKVFSTEIIGINQREPLFNTIQVNSKEFKSILKTHKNIIIISEGVQNSFHNNKWSSGQSVAQINWESDTIKLHKEFIKLRSYFVKKELKSIRSSLIGLSQKKNEQIILKNFGVQCIIPSEYRVTKSDSSLFWANYNSTKSDEIKNIIVFSFSPKTKNTKQEILLRTDSVFKKYLIGQKEGTFARIEPQFTPYHFNNTYRGLWKLENGFMGGPFIIKTYSKNNKIVVNIGMVFAPQNSKRKYIKEFEAIL